jgi:serine/threonine protein kinase
MSLSPGPRLGAYEILTLIGAGGMGEVYRATDINLKRQVAIKGSHRDPHLLPDGQHFLCSVFGGRHDQNGIYVGSPAFSGRAASGLCRWSTPMSSKSGSRTSRAAVRLVFPPGAS